MKLPQSRKEHGVRAKFTGRKRQAHDNLTPLPIPETKLAIELVPISSWGLNLSKLLAKAKWDELRRATYATALHRCEICSGVGSRHPVECHEVWEFIPAKKLQRLTRLIALCPACHSVKHYGRLGGLAPEYRAAAFAHLCKVNDWTKTQAEAHIASARAEWLSRCKIHWRVDTSLIGVQVDRGQSRGELLAGNLGDAPADPDLWAHLGDIDYLGVSLWQRKMESRRRLPS